MTEKGLRPAVENLMEQIPEGHESRITIKELSKILSINPRQVKRDVQVARMDGHAIISHPDGGYFLPKPDDQEDMRIALRFVATLKAQAASRFRVAWKLESVIENMKQVWIYV